jgi:CBS domain-containing protein
MTTDVVTVRRDTRFKEVVRLMAERGVGGVPVVDSSGTLAGMLGESELLKVEVPERQAGTRRRRRAGPEEDVRARDLMTHRVVSVEPETPVTQVARLMLQQGVERLPVLDGGRVAGMVSREDLLRPFLRADMDILGDVRRLIEHDLWLDPSRIIVRVQDGVVSIVGDLDRRSDRDLLVREVHLVPGVVGVEANVTYEADDKKPGRPGVDPARVGTTSLPSDFLPGSLRGR